MSHGWKEGVKAEPGSRRAHHQGTCLSKGTYLSCIRMQGCIPAF